MAEENKVTEALEEFGKRELGDVKVLMIEDDPIITDLVTQKLSMSGCIPYSTLDSTEALKLAEHFQPDVVILDLMMPKLSGEEIIQAMKADDNLKNIPILVFTNKSSDEDMQNVLTLGAAEYLVKASTELNQLVEVVKRLAASKV